MSFVILVSLYLHAQNDLVIKGTKHITKEMTPQQVVDSLEKHFPNAKSVQYYKAPASVTNNGWAVTTEDNLESGDEVDYYTISFKKSGLKYYGLYDKNGVMLKAKIEQSNTTLPEAVQTSLKNLGQKYPGYKVVSKTYFKNTEYSKK
jgi:hypothetical protein